MSPHELSCKSRIWNHKTAHREKRTDFDITARHGNIAVRGCRAIKCASLRHHFHMHVLIGQNIVDWEEPYQEEQCQCCPQQPNSLCRLTHSKIIIADGRI